MRSLTVAPPVGATSTWSPNWDTTLGRRRAGILLQDTAER
jgi:hypothetical protein